MTSLMPIENNTTILYYNSDTIDNYKDDFLDQIEEFYQKNNKSIYNNIIILTKNFIKNIIALNGVIILLQNKNKNIIGSIISIPLDIKTLSNSKSNEIQALSSTTSLNSSLNSLLDLSLSNKNNDSEIVKYGIVSFLCVDSKSNNSLAKPAEGTN